jgi:hypothetical protein
MPNDVAWSGFCMRLHKRNIIVIPLCFCGITFVLKRKLSIVFYENYENNILIHLKKEHFLDRKDFF